MSRSALVSDFDGTITRTDFYILIAERYMAPDAMSVWEEYRAGRLSHFDTMQRFFSQAPEDEAVLRQLLVDVQPDPAFADSVILLEDAGWDLIIVSAGCSWYIERILQQTGVRATVHSNPGRIVKGKGLLMQRDVESPFYSEDVGIDKTAVLKDARSRYSRVAFAGDGPPDVAPALATDQDLRFARGFLAEELRRSGESFCPFERWSKIAEALVGS